MALEAIKIIRPYYVRFKISIILFYFGLVKSRHHLTFPIFFLHFLSNIFRKYYTIKPPAYENPLRLCYRLDNSFLTLF